MPAMMMMMMIMMDDPGVSFSSSFCSYIKTPFFILFGWLVVVEQSSPPLHFFFRKMSSTTNVILHTHTHTQNCPALWCRGSTPFSRPHQDPRVTPFLVFPFVRPLTNGTNERTNNANVFLEGIVRIQTIVSLHKPSTFQQQEK